MPDAVNVHTYWNIPAKWYKFFRAECKKITATTRENQAKYTENAEGLVQGSQRGEAGTL